MLNITLAQSFATVYYAYPAILPVVLATSHVIYFRKDASRHEVTFYKHPCQSLWYLQACLTFTLSVSMVISIISFRRNVQNEFNTPLLHAQMTSYIGLSFYFGSGLLPDPDGPFSPSKPNCQAWLAAIVFQAVIIVFTQFCPSASGYLRISTWLECSRIFILIFMVVAFYNKWRLPWHSFGTDDERDNFTSNGVLALTYGTVAPQGQSSIHAVGWLDYFYGFRRLFPYIWPSESREQLTTILCFILLVLQRIVNIMVPRQLGILVEALEAGPMPYKDIALFCLYRGLQGQQGVIGSIRAILWIPISQSLYSKLTEAAYEHVLLLSLDFHHSKRTGEVMSALNKGGALNTFLDGFAFQLFPIVLDLGIAAIYLFMKYDAFYSIIVVAVMWSYIFVTVHMAKYRTKVRREMAMKDRDIDAAKSDAIMAYETVHYNGAVRQEMSKIHRLMTGFQEAEFSVIFSLNALNAAQNGIFILGIILVCVLSAYQITITLLKISDFISLVTYFAQLQAPLAFFGSFYNQVQNNLVDAERMLELFNAKPEVVDRPGVKPISELDGRVTVTNATFRYGHGRPALEDVSFDVGPGTSAAIVGESGSGKSTILKLLFRFYNLNAGTIRFDGVDMQSIATDSLRSHIGVVPQDTVLFNASLMWNLLYARPDATEDQVFEACRAASIHETILRFPEAYDTVVGERGLKLSGGEKQRVAIARAILKNPRIMLLDEATASLDSNTEKLIQGALENVTRNRTTIVVAHRLSTITQVDQILVLHMGRIVERGTHEELLTLRGRYLTMWTRQTAREQETS